MSREAMILYWIEKAEQDIASAKDNYTAERLVNAVREAYFACFPAFSALLLKDEKTFKKHREVRAALHRDYIRTQKLEPECGKHYDWLFDNRQKADYRPFVQFEAEQVKEIIEKSEAFVYVLKNKAINK